MATYGIDFPFRDSTIGNYLKMTSTPEREVRADLIHLLLTRKGSRYFLPDFGTRLYEYIFEPNDTISFNHIEDEIRESVRKYIPNLDINSIVIASAENDPDLPLTPSEEEDARLFRVSNDASKPYTARVKIDYTVNNGTFSTSDFIIINILMGRIKICDIIKESRDVLEGFNEAELSEDYPVDFDLWNFKNLRSYAEKLRYAESHLGKPLGRGSARMVYRVDNDKVLKLAKNKKGIAQNEAEIDWYGETYYEDMLAKVFDYDREGSLWVEMEIAYRVKPSDFRRLWGIDFKDLYLYLKNKYFENKGRGSMFSLDKEIKYQLDNNDFVMHLVSFMYDSDAPDGDLSKLNSWGLVHRADGDTIVLIDFGLTNNVYQSYYA